MVKKALLILGIIALFSSSAFAANKSANFSITLTIPEKASFQKQGPCNSQTITKNGNTFTLNTFTAR